MKCKFFINHISTLNAAGSTLIYLYEFKYKIFTLKSHLIYYVRNIMVQNNLKNIKK